MEKIMLVDGNSIINRAYYALPLLTNSEGEYTNGVYGFLNILFKFLDEERPDYLAVAFDVHAPTFRHKEFAEYKGTRKSMPEEMRPQIPLLKSLLAKMNIPVLEMAGYEADDILGTLAKRSADEGKSVTIVSGDRDLLQLAAPFIKIMIPKTKGGRTEVESYQDKDVEEKIGVTPLEYIDVKALMGDASDNIPGVPGIGEKTAVKIIKEYKNIETAIENAEHIKPKKASENLREFKEQAVLSKYLATIITDVPVDFSAQKIPDEKLYNKEAFEEFKRLGFKNHFKRFSFEEEPAKISKPFEYELLTKTDEAEKFVEKLDTFSPVSFSILYSDNKSYAVSFSYGEETTLCLYDEFSEFMFLNILKNFFESDKEKIALNSKRDKVYLSRFGIKVNNIIFDSMLAGYVLNSSKSSYDYNDIAADFLNEAYPSEEDFFGKGKSKKSPHSILDKKSMTDFCARQSDVIHRAYPIMLRKIRENKQEDLYFEIEMPLVDVLMDMELFGMKINKDELLAYQQALDAQVENLTAEIYNLAGEEFNINSPKQLGIILFENLGLKGGKKTKTGYSTAHDVLEKMVDIHPIIEKILEYRTVSKLKSTYADGLINILDENNKIYSTFNQFITTTGRISSTEPNLQNIPIRMEIGRLLRKAFIPSEEKYVFLDADYSQIELRVLASMANDSVMIEAFNNNEDIHRLTASQAFNIPIDEVTPEQRSNAKAVNFGIVYGIGPYSLSQDLKITVAEATKYIDGYFEKYPNVKIFMDTEVKKAKDKGYAETLYGRRRNIPELKSSNFNMKEFGKRIAMNMPIQGTAADIIKIAMIKVRNRLKAENLDARLILQVHDELLLEVCRDDLESARKIVKEEMEQAASLDVKLVADEHVGENWYDAK